VDYKRGGITRWLAHRAMFFKEGEKGGKIGTRVWGKESHTTDRPASVPYHFKESGKRRKREKEGEVKQKISGGKGVGCIITSPQSRQISGKGGGGGKRKKKGLGVVAAPSFVTEGGRKLHEKSIR